MRSTVYFVAQAWQHMGAVSGYGNLLAAFGKAVQGRLEKIDPFTLWQRREPQAAQVLTVDEFLPWVDARQQYGCEHVIVKLKASRQSVALLTAGEDQVSALYLQQPEQLLKRVFVVFHQPPSWFVQQAVDPAIFNPLGGVVCLSEGQARFFEQAALRNVIRSRHGINHDFFHPGSAQPGAADYVLFVGQWMRDFDLLEQTMQRVWQSSPLRLKCVVGRPVNNSPAMMRLAADPRVELLTSVPDEALRDLYRQSAATLLPLKDAVANNALLEAIACASPLVVTDLPSTREYAQGQQVYFARPGDPGDHANGVLRLAGGQLPDGEQRAISLLDFTRRHSWQPIADRLVSDMGLAHAS
jgi:glycosyltransferase involved in cell wall biosynthesis